MRVLRERVNHAFGDVRRPSKITIDDVGESRTIQNDFHHMLREHMRYEDVSMMLVDAALISDRAIAYFLPRLVDAVLIEGGNAFLLARRLELFDRTELSDRQAQVMEDLLHELREIERMRDADEVAELQEGRAAWRDVRTRSGLAEDHLLLAVERGDVAEVSELLRNGADPRYRDELGNTAVDLARRNGHDAVLELLSRFTE